MIKNIKRFAFLLAFIICIFNFPGTALAVTPTPVPQTFYEEEIIEEELIEDQPAEHNTEPRVMYDISEVGMPEIPAWDFIIMQWEKEGYPDDIGGYYYDNALGSYGILVVNPSQKRIDELNTMFENSVVITPCVFSYNELRQVQNEITEMMSSNPDGGIYSTGIGWTSADGVVFGFGESGKEFRVNVSVDKEAFYHYHTGLTARYGDRVYVDISSPISLEDGMDGMIMPGGGVQAEGAADPVKINLIEITGVFTGSTGYGSIGGNTRGSTDILLWIIAGAVLLCALLLLVRFRMFPVPAKQTVNGGVIASGAPLTGKQVIAAVKESGSEPGDGVLQAILQQIGDGSADNI